MDFQPRTRVVGTASENALAVCAVSAAHHPPCDRPGTTSDIEFLCLDSIGGQHHRPCQDAYHPRPAIPRDGSLCLAYPLRSQLLHGHLPLRRAGRATQARDPCATNHYRLYGIAVDAGICHAAALLYRGGRAGDCVAGAAADALPPLAADSAVGVAGRRCVGGSSP